MLCAAEKAGLTAPHHSGAALELVTDSGQWNALKAAHGLETPTSAAVCACAWNAAAPVTQRAMLVKRTTRLPLLLRSIHGTAWKHSEESQIASQN